MIDVSGRSEKGSGSHAARRRQVTDHLLLRKGSSKNVMVFPESDYDDAALSVSGGTYTFTHQAYGADKFRYSANFGKNWTQWQNFEATSTLNTTLFQDKDNFWDGDHVMVQCE